MSSYEDVSSFAKLIECICPMCEKKHKRLIYWTGNGIPRKRCLDCENTVIRSDDVEVDEYGVDWKIYKLINKG